MATGEEEPGVTSIKNVSACLNPDVAEEKDLYQEGEDDCTEKQDV